MSGMTIKQALAVIQTEVNWHAGSDTHYRAEKLEQSLATLRAEIERLEKDAARYRWLRGECKNPIGVLTIARVTEWGLEAWSGDDPDNRIDAAMSKEGK